MSIPTPERPSGPNRYTDNSGEPVIKPADIIMRPPASAARGKTPELSALIERIAGAKHCGGTTEHIVQIPGVTAASHSSTSIDANPAMSTGDKALFRVPDAGVPTRAEIAERAGANVTADPEAQGVVGRYVEEATQRALGQVGTAFPAA